MTGSPRHHHPAGRVARSRTPLLDANVYTFVVAPDANKIEIRDAVEAIFSVQVAKVNTLNRKGKRKRNRRTATCGTAPDTKRAIVTLAAGDRIEHLRELTHAASQAQAHQPRSPVPDRLRLRGDHEATAREVAARAQAAAPAVATPTAA